MVAIQTSLIFVLGFLIFSVSVIEHAGAVRKPFPYSCKLRSYKQKFRPSNPTLCQPIRIRINKCVGSCPSSAFPIIPSQDGGEYFKKICECCNAKISAKSYVVKFKGNKCQETKTISKIESCECKPCNSRDD
ncbi:hypothetical protein AC249_AIPGENE13263 [Exaiptasia diaphana]|nr:hypothetical protein AC249_AIPGENE13263 [Exaiptasia diaphana]